MKIAILINGSIRKFQNTLDEIKKGFENLEHQIFISNYAGHFKKLCAQALDDDYQCFVFVGGDGSLNEGINGIIKYHQINDSENDIDFDWLAISKINVGVFAAGSGNDFIKSVNLDESLSTLVTNIKNQSSKMVDVGWMRCLDFNDKKTVNFFINVTDVGMGGEVVRRKSKMPQFLSGKLTYFLAITTTIALYKKCHLKAYNNSFQWQGKVLNMIVANAKYFGNSLGIAPDADVTDGQFSLVIVGDVSLFEYFKKLPQLKKCVKLKHLEISYHKVNEIHIDPTDRRTITIDMDGELIGKAPMTLKCLQQKINFIC